MSIKTSNQITFTEHKKIIKIKEWYLATSAQSGVTINTSGWTETIQTIDSTNKYLWNYEEVVYSIGPSEISDPIIIGFYGGKGIADIKNYYYITSEPELPNNPNWSPTVLLLSPTGKFLWNYEELVYTDGSSKSTDPAIIGVYGDSGTSTITFEIYSVHGFMFKNNLKSIELKIASFDGNSQIENVTYIWSWWDGSLNGGVGGYVKIIETAEPTFTINETDTYAFENLKCVMQYNGNTYEDYVVLTTETIIYNAVVKFFNGSNIFDASTPFIVAYLDLYKDQQEEEKIKAQHYYYHEDNTYNVLTDQYTFNANGINSIYNTDGSLMYIIYRVVNAANNCAKYKARLCIYNNGSWETASGSTYENKYLYKNDLYNNLYDDITTNVIVISKEDISKSKDINFVVYPKILDESSNIIYDDDLIVARAHATVIDLNDPIISTTEPSNPKSGQLWLNTSKTPYTLYIYENGSWVYFTQQNGKTIYTSKPNSYSKGDLWILAVGEKCEYTLNDVEYSFKEGSMLRAKESSSTHVSSHWEDAMKDFTTLKNNIDQYFTFSAANGLTIGQSDKKFHVNITSEKMGFYDGDTEVVHISNKSANIDNLTVEHGLIADCSTTLNGDTIMQKQINNKTYKFIWQVEESNGSLSLVVVS